MGDEPDRPDEPTTDEERERLYHLGALAQSYAPRGLVDVLRLSPQGRARARAQWRAQPRRNRVLFYAIIGAEVVWLGVLIWGMATRDALMMLIAAGAILAVVIGTTVVTVVSEVRRTKPRR